MHAHEPDEDRRSEEPAEGHPDPEPAADPDIGAEGGEHSGSAPVPFAPDEDDDSPLGDTDQHSDA